MNKKHARLTDESGQAVAWFAIAFVAICAVAAMVVDLGSVSLAQSDLQIAADAAALAAAQDLPDSAAAHATALYYGELNGAPQTTATTPYDGDPSRIEVVCSRTVSYTFARMLGFSDKQVSARAVAVREGGGGVFDFTLFSGDPDATLTLTGAGLYVGGSVHSNYRYSMTGSGSTVNGSVEALSRIALTGSSMTITGTATGSPVTTTGSHHTIGAIISSPADWLDMPDFSEEIRLQAESCGQLYIGDLHLNGSSLTLDEPLYVDGDVMINGCNFYGTGFVLATGDIRFIGSGMTSVPGDAVCFYSENGDISITGAGAVVEGILYAPNGTIAITGAGVRVNGRIIANRLSLTGAGYRIVSGEDDLNCLPGSSVRLAE